MPEEGYDVSCLNSRAIIEYIRRSHPGRLRELFSALPAPWSDMPSIESFLSEENNWIPSSLIVRLFENARAITADPDVAFHIGFDSIVNREFGYWQSIFVRFLSSPRSVMRRLNQYNSKLNSTKLVELVYDTPGRAVIRWHWRDGVISSKDACSYNRGIYSAIPTMWGLPAAQVTEDHCAFEGDRYCEVIISWGRNISKFRGILSQLFVRKSSLLDALEEIERDKVLLRKKFDELRALNLELNRRVTVLKAINNATRALVSVSDTREVLQETMRPIVDELGFDRAVIMLVDQKHEFLEYSYAVGESKELLGKMKDYRIPLTREQNLMIRVLKKHRSVLIRDVKAAGLNPANKILADFGPNSFVVCPLIAEDQAIGILAADRKTDQRPLASADAEFLTIFANNIATVFQRARLDEQLKKSYVASVRALVQAIEEKDTYTRGHSERVAAIVVHVARELGISEEEIEYLRFGSILHDVGKIGIPESIVRSPKPLTEGEYKIIQKHPLKGLEILQHIPFIREHMYLIRSHHERWDGKGYPDGLRGDEIPLGAQIVAIADAFDAMTSSRPYRKGLPPKQAAREIKKGVGTQFSSSIVDAFLTVFDRLPDLRSENGSTKKK
ncbi:MAG TPA: HD domain-containing phosphohydrolase [Spirochaetia bacterium]|nr:HD domain-containing phosphohydrolase [Spirochaetia bacterium]